MKALYVVVLFWAVDATASRCRPSSPLHSSSAALLSSSSVISSSSSVVSSSSSVVSSSSSVAPSFSSVTPSSSSSGPAPSQSHVCGNQLIPSDDFNLIDNTRHDWLFSASNGATTDSNSYLFGYCTTVYGGTATKPFTYSIGYSTPPSTLTIGPSYRFSFTFIGGPPLAGKPLVCTAANSVGPASASFEAPQAWSDNPNIVLFDFVSTYKETKITCTFQNLPIFETWRFCNFSLKQLC